MNKRIEMQISEHIGLFGGTFDPIHSGHLRAAEFVRKKFALQPVLFVPSCTPPHKKRGASASARDRLKMVELALVGRSGFVASSVEVDAGGVSYAVDTLKQISKLYPRSRIYYIIGVDAFLEIDTWKNYDQLLEECSFIIINRPGYPLPKVREILEGKYRERMVEFTAMPEMKDAAQRGPSLFLLRFDALDISSSHIRECLRQGKPIHGLVPAPVEAYIRGKKLYQDKS